MSFFLPYQNGDISADQLIALCKNDPALLAQAKELLRQGLADGLFSISLTDADGNPMAITDSMWDGDGNLIPPQGAQGTITGPGSDVLSFTNVETITLYGMAGDDPMGGGHEGGMFL